MQMFYGALRTRLTDRNLVLGLVALSVLVSLSFFWDHRAIFFYQNYMKPAVMFACGHGWTDPTTVPQALTDFLRLQVDTFDCALLADVDALAIRNDFFSMHLYLAGTAGLLWRVFGVDYVALLPLIIAIHVAWSLGCYRLARLWFSLRLPCSGRAGDRVSHRHRSHAALPGLRQGALYHLGARDGCADPSCPEATGRIGLRCRLRCHCRLRPRL